MDDVRWLEADEQRAWRSYLDATRLLVRALEAQLEADADISLTDYELLVHLSEAPGRRMRMRDLADATLATRSGVSRAVSRCEQAGWVRRVECQEDRRGTLAELTPAGQDKLAAAAPGHVAAVRAAVFDQLTAAQLRQLTTICSHLADNLRSPGTRFPEPRRGGSAS